MLLATQTRLTAFGSTCHARRQARTGAQARSQDSLAT